MKTISDKFVTRRYATRLACAACVALAAFAVASGTNGVINAAGKVEPPPRAAALATAFERETRTRASVVLVPGPRGTRGAAGARGAKGSPGRAGVTVNNGVVGPAGSDGANGVAGADGSRGPAGSRGEAGSQGKVGAAGRQGEAGAAGSQGLAGLQGADDTDGIDGTNGTNGSNGSNGADGAPGATGAQGAQGLAGVPGADGAQGPQGAQGAIGPQGATGSQGATGPQGAAGTPGVDGAQGPAGPQGATGEGASAIEGYRDGDVALADNTTVTVATLPAVAPGQYLILAKTTVIQTAPSNGGGPNGYTRCTVNGDPAANSATDDWAETELGRGSAAESGRATLQMQVTVDIAATGPVSLRCRRNNDSGSPSTAMARESKVIAVKLASASRGILP